MPTTFRLARNVVLGVAALGAFVAGSAIALGITPNITDSMPVGFYRKIPLSGAPQRGQLVIACMPQWAVVYRRKAGLETRNGPCPGNSISILKIVAATPGDTVRVTDAGVYVDGRLWPNTRLHALNSRGGPIPRGYLHRMIVIAPGSYWLMTPRLDSFDSRYWGPATQILSGAVPVWTQPNIAAFERGVPGLGNS